MPTIILSDPDLTLSVDQTHFTLRSAKRKLCRIPSTVCEEVVIHQGVEVTRKAFARLGALGIPVTFLDREHRVEARLMPPWKHDPAPRLEQARVYHDPAARLALAKRFAGAKVANQAALIRTHLSNHPNERLSAIARQLRHIPGPLADAPTLDAVRGHEGLAARTYFEGLGLMLRSDWTSFTSRQRRPPQDPVNAILSYTYAVLTHRAASYLETVGLDPYIGYLHSAERGRPSLALDLIEPLRPALADRFMLRLMNLGMLGASHFEQRMGFSGHGTFLTFEGRSLLIREFVPWTSNCDETLGPDLPSPDSILRKSVERLRSLAADGRLPEFEPYRMSPQPPITTESR